MSSVLSDSFSTISPLIFIQFIIYKKCLHWQWNIHIAGAKQTHSDFGIFTIFTRPLLCRRGLVQKLKFWQPVCLFGITSTFLGHLKSFQNHVRPYKVLAPTGALIVIMVYYISMAAPTFSDFHSVSWCNWCYKCHSKSLKQYQCNWCHKMLIECRRFKCFNVPMFPCSNVQTLKFPNLQMFKWSNVQTSKSSNVQIFKCYQM